MITYFTRTGSPGAYTLTLTNLTGNDTNGDPIIVNALYYATAGGWTTPAAASGDTIVIQNPSGASTYNLGLNGFGVRPVAGVTITSATNDPTAVIFNVSSPSGGVDGVARMAVAAGGVITGIGFVSTTGEQDTVFGATGGGWRITNCIYTDTAHSTSTFFGGGLTGSGCIDHCTILGYHSELIFTRGPTNAWQTPDCWGNPSAQPTIYVETCTFGPDSGYVSDFNSNSRAVVRFCTIEGGTKIDAHGLQSNTPGRSCRSLEVYGNTWTSSTPSGEAMEFRGGNGVVFNNTSAGFGALSLAAYECTAMGGSYTTGQYAIPDQVGSGEDQTGTLTFTVGTGNPATVTTSGPLNIPIGTEFHLASAGVASPGGTTTITSTSTPALTTTNSIDCTVTGPNTFTVPVNVTVGGTGSMTWGYFSSGGQASPVYGWGNTQSSANWALTAIDNGQNCGPWITENRDYYDYNASFNGTDGVGVGTTAQMNAITPSKIGVGFWCTDQGSWNHSGSGGQGELYVWNGSAWVLKYTPYQYPFYSAGPPVVTPATTYATVGVAFSYQINANNAPTGFTVVSGKPSWATVNSGGLITGTPPNTTGQPFSLVVYATNGSGDGSNATITICVGNAPVITSASTASGVVGQFFSYTITASNLPTDFWTVGTIPPGLTVSGAVISGTPTTASTYPISALASNNYGSGSQGVTITISPPTITGVTITGPFTFTGLPLTPTYTTTPSGGSVAFTPTTETNTGTHTMSWSGTGIYSGSGTTPWTIVPSVAIDVIGNATFH